MTSRLRIIGGNDRNDPAKLKRDSPRRHAADFRVPVQTIHGTTDAQAPIEQSEAMDAALTRSGMPHRFVRVPDADHSFSEVKDKVTLMREIEGFLSEHLPAAGSATPAVLELVSRSYLKSIGRRSRRDGRMRLFALGGRKHHDNASPSSIS